MPKYRYSMTIDGIERVAHVTITNKELTPRHMISTYDPLFYELYRRNLIETKLNSWALSKLNLSWEEVTQDGTSTQEETCRKHGSESDLEAAIFEKGKT